MTEGSNIVSIVDNPESEFDWSGQKLKLNQVNVKVRYENREPTIHTCMDMEAARAFKAEIERVIEGTNPDKVGSAEILQRQIVEMPCSNCDGRVVYHTFPCQGWGHVLATGCVKPAVSKENWLTFLKLRKTQQVKESRSK